MAHTTQEDIRRWLEEAERRNSTHLIVAVDGWDHEDYPVFCPSENVAVEKYHELNGKNMQRVMEVYDLSMDWGTQLNEFRAFHLNIPRPR